MLTVKTGEQAPESGIYRFVGPTNEWESCEPTAEELKIPLTKGQTVPPVKSCSTGGVFTLIVKG